MLKRAHTNNKVTNSTNLYLLLVCNFRAYKYKNYNKKNKCSFASVDYNNCEVEKHPFVFT